MSRLIRLLKSITDRTDEKLTRARFKTKSIIRQTFITLLLFIDLFDKVTFIFCVNEFDNIFLFFFLSNERIKSTYIYEDDKLKNLVFLKFKLSSARIIKLVWLCEAIVLICCILLCFQRLLD